jgi:hypothetical protein
VPWHSLATELGPVEVQPMNLQVLSIRSGCLTINRVQYLLYGPLYREAQRWTAHQAGRHPDWDPDFTLLRLDNVNRQGSHSAYRKAVGIIEAAVNAWTPGERELASLAIQRIESDIAEQRAHLAKLRNDPDYQTKYLILLKGQEDYLLSLSERLEHAQDVLKT